MVALHENLRGRFVQIFPQSQLFLTDFIDNVIVVHCSQNVLVNHFRRSLAYLVNQVEMPLESTVLLRHSLHLGGKLPIRTVYHL